MNTSDTDSPPSGRTTHSGPAGWGADVPSVITGSPDPLAAFGSVDNPALSIITVTFGVSPAQPRMWAGIGESTDDTADAEMIVVDNPHPTWGHAGADLVSLYTRGVSVIRPDENLGFGGGNNLGVDRCRADIICLLNPDVVIAPGDLPRLVSLARDHPDDVIAPVLLNDDGTVQEMGGRISRDGTTRPIRATTGPDADYASAACWVMFRERFVELGGFDPVYHPAYYEDVDFTLRLQRAGGRTVVDHSTRLVHAWSPHHLRRAPDTREQHRILRNRWADELATRPALRRPRTASGPSRTTRSSPPSTTPQ